MSHGRGTLPGTVRTGAAWMDGFAPARRGTGPCAHVAMPRLRVPILTHKETEAHHWGLPPDITGRRWGVNSARNYHPLQPPSKRPQVGPRGGGLRGHSEREAETPPSARSSQTRDSG